MSLRINNGVIQLCGSGAVLDGDSPCCGIMTDCVDECTCFDVAMRALNERIGRSGSNLFVTYPDRLWAADGSPLAPPESPPTRAANEFFASLSPIILVSWPSLDFYANDLIWDDVNNGNPAGTYAAGLINTYIRPYLATGGVIDRYVESFSGSTVNGWTEATLYPGGVLPDAAIPSTVCDSLTGFRDALRLLQAARVSLTNTPDGPTSNSVTALYPFSIGAADTVECMRSHYPAMTPGTADIYTDLCVFGTTDPAVPGTAQMVVSVGESAGQWSGSIGRYCNIISVDNFADWINAQSFKLYIYFNRPSLADVQNYIAPSGFGSPAESTFFLLQTIGGPDYALSTAAMDSGVNAACAIVGDPLPGQSNAAGYVLAGLQGTTTFNWDVNV